MTMRNHFAARQMAFGPNPHNDFMLAHGVEYTFNAEFLRWAAR